MDNNMDRMQLMKEIGEASFMVNDLTLYLDTHPTDQEALKAFSEQAQLLRGWRLWLNQRIRPVQPPEAPEMRQRRRQRISKEPRPGWTN